jgi:hypothetical protein
MNSRAWLWRRLTENAPLTALIPSTRIYSSGSLFAVPDVKPFLMIRLEPMLLGPFNGTEWQDSSIWIHDVPGSYVLIDSVLSAVREAMISAGSAEGDNQFMTALHQGDSQDLVDDGFNTITRNGSYRLVLVQ